MNDTGNKLHEGQRQLNVWIPDELHKTTKRDALDFDVTLQERVIAALIHCQGKKLATPGARRAGGAESPRAASGREGAGHSSAGALASMAAAQWETRRKTAKRK